MRSSTGSGSHTGEMVCVCSQGVLAAGRMLQAPVWVGRVSRLCLHLFGTLWNFTGTGTQVSSQDTRDLCQSQKMKKNLEDRRPYAR